MQTDRQTDRQTVRQTDTQREREGERERETNKNHKSAGTIHLVPHLYLNPPNSIAGTLTLNSPDSVAAGPRKGFVTRVVSVAQIRQYWRKRIHPRLHG